MGKEGSGPYNSNVLISLAWSCDALIQPIREQRASQKSVAAIVIAIVLRHVNILGQAIEIALITLNHKVMTSN